MQKKFGFRHLILMTAISATSPFMAAQAQSASKPDDTLPGKDIYEQSCAMCHENPADERAASFDAITSMPPSRLRSVLGEGGVMAPMAAALSKDQIDELVDYLTSGQSQKVETASWIEPLMCAPDNRIVDLSGPETFTTFGVDQYGSRHLQPEAFNVSNEQMKSLDIAWAIAFPKTTSVSAAPVSVGSTSFINGGEKLFAFDTKNNCAKWVYDGGWSKSPLTYGEIDGKKSIIYNVDKHEVHAVDALSGELIWKTDAKPVRGDGGGIRSGVILHEDKIIVPISASGVGGGGDYCCTGHGAVLALNASDGSLLWEYHTMEEAKDTGLINIKGQKMRGPSGAPIWAQPTIDVKHNRVLVATGENTSLPVTDTSDAIIALNLDTGEQEWLFQAMAGDAWNMQCRASEETSGPNCPWRYQDGAPGRDFDFGSPVVLRTVQIDGKSRDLALAGQKSGHLWALDAETGEKVWSVRVGVGTALGGNHWGIAADDTRAYLTINDPVGFGARDSKAKPGVYAFNLADGEPVWSYESQPACDDGRSERVIGCDTRYGFSATPLVAGNAVVAGTLDGRLFSFDAATGDVLSIVDTAVALEALNPEAAKGGSIDSHAIAAADGMLLVGSGYALFRQTPGNVILAIKPAADE